MSTKQTYSSANTSINQTKLPAIYTKLDHHKLIRKHSILVDYGCGKYTEHIKNHCHDRQVLPFFYDPYNQPDEVNNRTKEIIRRGHRFNVAVCSNVLNVIDSDDQVRTIIDDLARIADEAYITVYEGDKSGNGRQTGPDQYQRNQRINEYLQFASDIGVKAELKYGMIHIITSK